MGALVFAMHKEPEREDKFYVLTSEGIQMSSALPQENLTMDDIKLLTNSVKKENPGLMIEFVM